jgi:hypothetical protein
MLPERKGAQKRCWKVSQCRHRNGFCACALRRLCSQGQELKLHCLDLKELQRDAEGQILKPCCLNVKELQKGAEKALGTGTEVNSMPSAGGGAAERH